MVRHTIKILQQVNDNAWKRQTECCITPESRLLQFALIKKYIQRLFSVQEKFKTNLEKKKFSPLSFNIEKVAERTICGKNAWLFQDCVRGRVPFWNSFDAREILKYFSTIVVVGCWFTMWFAHVQLRICTYGQHFKCISKRLKMRAERNNAIGIRAQTKIFKTWYKKSQFFVLQNKSYWKSIPKSVTGHTHKIHSYSCWRVFF